MESFSATLTSKQKKVFLKKALLWGVSLLACSSPLPLQAAITFNDGNPAGQIIDANPTFTLTGDTSVATGRMFHPGANGDELIFIMQQGTTLTMPDVGSNRNFYNTNQKTSLECTIEAQGTGATILLEGPSAGFLHGNNQGRFTLLQLSGNLTVRRTSGNNREIVALSSSYTVVSPNPLSVYIDPGVVLENQVANQQCFYVSTNQYGSTSFLNMDGTLQGTHGISIENGNTIAINVGGTITATGNAIQLANGKSVITLKAGSAVSGNIILGSNSGTSLTVDATASVDGNITTQHANQVITLEQATYAGDIAANANGRGQLVVNADSLEMTGIIGATNQLGSVTVKEGKELIAKGELNVQGSVTVEDNARLEVHDYQSGNFVLGDGARVELLDAAANLTGTVNGAVDDQGTFVFAHDFTLNQAIGASKRVEAVEIADTKTLTLNASIYGGVVFGGPDAVVSLTQDDLTIAKAVSGTGTLVTNDHPLTALTLGANADVTVSGVLDTPTVSVGADATLTAQGDVSGTSLTLGAGARLVAKGALDIVIDGAADDQGTVEVAEDVTLNQAIGGTKRVEAVEIADTKTLTLNASIYGGVVFGGPDAVVSLGQDDLTIEKAVSGTGTLVTNDHPLTALTLGANADVTVSGALDTPTVSVGADAVLTAESSVSGTSLTLGAGARLVAKGALDIVIDGAADDQGTVEIGEDVTLNQAMGASKRVEAVEVVDGKTLTLGAVVHGDVRLQGVDAEVVLGTDGLSVLGASVMVSRTRVEQGDGRVGVGVGSVLGSVYGEWRGFGDGETFVEGVVTYGVHTVSQRRKAYVDGRVGGSLYEMRQWGAQVMVGRDVRGVGGRWVVTPSLRVLGGVLASEGYRERGAGVLNVTLAPQRWGFGMVSPEVKVGWLQGYVGEWHVWPQGMVRMNVDVGRRDHRGEARLEGLPWQTFEVPSRALKRVSLEGSISVRWSHPLGVSLTTQYTTHYRRHHHHHALTLEAKYRF